MTEYNGRRTLQWVTKITKYCNLRCTYCYEYPDLDKKERMTTDGGVFSPCRRLRPQEQDR
jgi:molybdenum cofactor biosynthesis enzyme MoaA